MKTTPLTLESLLNYAIRLEALGEEFFLKWAEKADSDELKKFFRFLAEEEAGHRRVFEDLRNTVVSSESGNPESQEEYEAHFRVLTETILYSEKEMEAVKTLAEAVALAKKQELDAQLFFSDLVMYLPADAVGVVRRIIAEENRHFDRLSALEDKLFKQ
jgi:rubrerythrin